MRQALAKKLFAGSISAITALMLGLMPAVPVFAQSYPTVQINGGDVSAGGWFGNTCQSGSPYQDAAYTGGGISDHSSGGIYTYNGSRSQYAAYSMGVIDKSNNFAQNGFNSSAVLPGGNDRLSFANINYLSDAGYIGGNWDGGVANSSQCIPNYFDDKTPTGISAENVPISVNATGVHYYIGAAGGSTAVSLTQGATTINAAANIVVFITGNVYINNDIKYGPHDVTDIPKFTLIVKGNIYVGSGVKQLDGLYIAQPDSADFSKASTVTASTGEFWSCHDNDSTKTKLNSSDLAICDNKPLTVNGAVIAKRAVLLRLNDSSGVGETFNYTPEMVVGGSMFPGSTSATGSASGVPVFDRIVSLPPVF